MTFGPTPSNGHHGCSVRLRAASARTRVAVMVTKEPHCLQALLAAAASGGLPIEIDRVISNHPGLGTITRSSELEIEYHHIPVPRGGKAKAEARQLELLAGVELVILAKYMQVLSGQFLAKLGIPVINIHHSLLPAFPGANPYGQAANAGVKIIGATAHYVTDVLDGGAIIDQEAERVTTDSPDERALRKQETRIESQV